MLTRRARIVLDTLLPSGASERVPYGLLDVDFERFYEKLCREAPIAMLVGFHAALTSAIWVAPLLIGKLPPLSRLSRDDREAALRALGKSRYNVLRQMLLILKATSGFCYGGDVRVRDSIDFPLQFDDPRYPHREVRRA